MHVSLILGTAAALLALAPAARADCSLGFGRDRIDLGHRVANALLPAGQPGWRLLGSAEPLLTGVCTEPPARIRIAVGALLPAGEGLLHWRAGSGGAGGAASLWLQRASVGGVSVPVRLSTDASRSHHEPVALERDTIVELDTSTLPPDTDRRGFSLSLRVQGLVPDTYTARTAADFSLQPSFDWVD